MTKTLRFTVSGYYGCGNAGDEAVLAGIHSGLMRRAGERVRLTALSQDPQSTRDLHGLPAEYRMSRSTLRRTLAETDLLLSGGGSLLQDTTSMRSLLYYLWVARLAYSMSKPVMFYAQGLGPLHRALSRQLVRLVANRAAYITVRDEPSRQLLSAIGVHNPHIEVTADPAFALDPAPDEAIDRLIAQEQLPGDAPLIGVALRPWGQGVEQNLDDYARLLMSLERVCSARVVLLPMQVPGDVVFAENLVSRTTDPVRFPIVRQAASPALMLGLTGRMSAVVAMRLHTLIFAAHMSVPPFALAYDPKVRNLMQILNLEADLANWSGFDPNDIAERVHNILQTRSERVAALKVHSEDLERRALRNADCALNLFPMV